MSDKKSIEVLMDEKRIFYPRKEFSEKTYFKNMEEYEKLYNHSIENPEEFWAEMAQKELHWYKKWDKVLDYDFNKPYVKWFEGGKLNVSYNCLDRHVKEGRKNKAAIIWESNYGIINRTYTYQQLYYKVNRFANVLKKYGVKKGDRVMIYMPMIPELVIAMLACARIGAIHSIVFGGFSAQALKDRILDCQAKLLITAEYTVRGKKFVPLKANADEAIEYCPSIEKVIVVKGIFIPSVNAEMEPERDTWWHDELADSDLPSYCEPEWMDAEDPLFILYTSGSTGKPKGVLHTTGGYLLYAALTFKWIFDYHEDDIHFCTADIGWVTGHSYIVYGPLANGATSVIFEGIPNFPAPDRFWAIVEKYAVNIFYTAPTAIRALMRDGEKWTQKHDLSSIRVLGTVGEPINPEAWMWYYEHIGKAKTPIVDTWWQTETGGILITPLPGAMGLKPGSASRPFFGVKPTILKEDGSNASANEGGYLVIEKPWPGILRGTYGDPENKRVKEVYFSRFPGKYFSGDGARFDEDGYYWVMGRIDDVINISGHRLGTAEVESALVSHPAIAEAAVVGFPHEIKGEALYVYVILKGGYSASDKLKRELVEHVKSSIGPIAAPDKIQFSPGLPKTRSGKIMRRILRNIAKGDVENLGDTSTLADPLVVSDIIEGRL
ncbi:acetyl-CoA synthetase [Candidatus Magnetoovum chiemensis]|nr:acetyl-CoA synthetase [Candidatus Magnetoovum chiemensis]